MVAASAVGGTPSSAYALVTLVVVADVGVGIVLFFVSFGSAPFLLLPKKYALSSS